MISDADDRFNTRVYKIVRDFTEAFFFFFFTEIFDASWPERPPKKKIKKDIHYI